MRRALICLLVLILGLDYFSWAQIALPVLTGQPAKSSLVLDYDFSKTSSYPGSGTAVYDLQNTSAASLVNSPVFYVGTNYLNFSAASSQYLMTSADLSTKFSGSVGNKHKNTTLLLWVYPTASNGVVLSEQGVTTLNSGWHDSQIEMVGGVMKFRFWGLTPITSGISTPLNNWYLVALTYDGRYMKAYINGQLAGSVDDANRQTPYNNSTGLYYCLACADGTNLGSGAYGSFRLGRFRVYSNALALTDINTIYNAERTRYSDALFGLDAGNTASYPGSGATWYDLSGKANHVTLNNIAYQSSVGGGSMLFSNGSNSYANFSAPISAASTITVEMWVRTHSFNSGMYFGFYYYDVWTEGGAVGFNSASGDLYGLTAGQVSSLGILNNWKHLVFVMNTGSYLNNKIYVNGVAQTLSQVQGSQYPSVVNFNSGLGVISGWRGDASWRYIGMNLAAFNIYDREITATEIQGKFNSEKSRYGL